MEGRRVSRKARRNPLYVIFMGLLAAVVVLLIAVIVLGVKLGSANRDLAQAQEKIEQLQSGGAQQGESILPVGDDISGDAQDDDGGDPQGTAPEIGDAQDGGQSSSSDGQQTSATSGDVIDWLDLTGHSEVAVKPKSVYDKYYTYYTSDGVNLRAGPSTSYDKVKLLDLGTEVKAAAKQDGWTFVSVGGKFGWVNSDYLSTTRPEPQRTASTSASTTTTDTGASSAASTTTTDTGAATTTDTGATSGGSEMPDWLKVG